MRYGASALEYAPRHWSSDRVLGFFETKLREVSSLQRWQEIGPDLPSSAIADVLRWGTLRNFLKGSAE